MKIEIKELIKNNQEYLDKRVQINGWIRFKRVSKAIGFFTIYDGSNVNGIQIVFKQKEIGEKFDQLSQLFLHTPLEIEGTFKIGANKDFEIDLIEFKVLNNVDVNSMLGKKEHGLEFLRENAHIRVKTLLFQAVMKIRSFAFHELNNFFEKNNFHYVSAPIITSNDAEGAGETFKIVTSMNQPFWSNKNGVLSVSGQLHAEAYAQALGKVYTFAPTFRAENSNTSKHAAEFWMLEPEIAFSNYFDAMDLGENMLKHFVKNLLQFCEEELDILEKSLEINLKKNLSNFLNKKFDRVTYKEAVEILKTSVEKNKVNFINSDIYFGMDFNTEHERYLAEKHFKNALYVYDFPFSIKSFYMYRNKDKDDTVRGFDLLVPGIGELIGGSQREENYENLLESIKLKKLDLTDLEWYINLRKNGYAPSAGFGLGFERLLMFVTGMENIRDVLSFPRTPGKLIF